LGKGITRKCFDRIHDESTDLNYIFKILQIEIDDHALSGGGEELHRREEEEYRRRRRR